MSDEICGDVCADDRDGELPCVDIPGHSGSHIDARGATWAPPRHVGQHILKPQLYDGAPDRPLPRTTWCGSGHPAMGWCFQSLDHAAQTGLNGDSPANCRRCVEVAIKVLKVS